MSERRSSAAMAKFSVLLFVFCFILLASNPAHAYLDPASTSYILQILLAAIAGLVVVLKAYWHRILSLFGVHKKKTGETKSE
jgi:uncharacterized integral membrane protein